MRTKSPIREKLYRDPIHDIIALDVATPHGQVLSRLIDAPEVQRLRRVRQLGLAFVAYQGAEHSRFAHAIGVMHLMGRVLRQLQKGYDISDEEVFIGQCAALLHDIGHGPFSHVFERFAEKHHEDWGRDIILSPDSEVHAVLSEYSVALPATLTQVLHARTFKPGILTDLVSSQLDVDRFDYLLRDSLMTGVKHGIFDLERLIHVLRINPHNDRIVVSAKGLHPVEKYLTARYHMYRQVYQHKTVVAAEAMLTALLARVRLLLTDHKEGKALPRGLAKLTLPASVVRMLTPGAAPLTIAEYGRLDDPTFYYALNELTRAPDPVAADLAGRLLGRRLFKVVETDARRVLKDVSRRKRGTPPPFTKDAAERVGAVRRLLERHGLAPESYLLVIESSDAPYRPYDPKVLKQKNIEIEVPGGYADVSEASVIIKALQGSNYNMVRFVFPEAGPDGRDLRGPTAELLAPLVG